MSNIGIVSIQRPGPLFVNVKLFVSSKGAGQEEQQSETQFQENKAPHARGGRKAFGRLPVPAAIPDSNQMPRMWSTSQRPWEAKSIAGRALHLLRRRSRDGRGRGPAFCRGTFPPGARGQGLAAPRARAGAAARRLPADGGWHLPHRACGGGRFCLFARGQAAGSSSTPSTVRRQTPCCRPAGRNFWYLPPWAAKSMAWASGRSMSRPWRKKETTCPERGGRGLLKSGCLFSIL